MGKRTKMSEYDEAWITTYTGIKFHYKSPTVDEVNILDIAHHLSLLCRFTGASNVFYSVAEHSFRVAEQLPEGKRLAGLLHDAPEAYLGDISRPVKYSHKLDETERKISKVIEERFNVRIEHPDIKHIDSVLLATEARDLGLSMVDWDKLPTPLPVKISPLNPRFAESVFLNLFWYYREEGL